MAITTADHDRILQSVQSWPREELLTLAGEITRQALNSASGGRRYVSFVDARGLAATPGQPAPTDEEIDQWRLHKHD